MSFLPSQKKGERDDPSTNSDVSWEELRSTYLKSTTPSRRSYPLPSYGDAVHHADEGDSIDGRDPQPYGPRDAESSSDHLSIGIPNDPSPSSYKSLGRRSRSSHLARSNGLASSKKSAASYSKSPGDRFSPGTRAVSARKAARDAQLSAERALAAAAMASRAADLAAQAALEVRLLRSCLRVLFFHETYRGWGGRWLAKVVQADVGGNTVEKERK